MTVKSLQVLADNRNALLLAEAIGWLHDYRKCSEEHLETQAPGSKTQGLPRSELSNQQPGLQNISLALPTVQSFSPTVIDLLNDRRQDTLGQFLSRCHKTAHFDKQEPVGGKQNYPGTQISSAFGFERPVGTNLKTRLWNLPWSKLATLASDRQNLREAISTLFAQAVADSRRPINEVDLWSWGSLVGALYKSALAGSLLTGIVPSAQNLCWRLLGVRVDGLAYISNVARVPDLLARQKLLSDALDQVRTLLEVEYPLGSEVYRDQDGSIFIVPDVLDLLSIKDNQGTTLEAQIIQTFVSKVEGDLSPIVTLEHTPWWGQDPNWSRNATTTNDKLPDVKGMLTKPVATQADVQVIEAFWQGQSGNWEVCPVCRLRPMPEKAEACEHCIKHRSSRIEAWKQNPAQTIWIDEIADHNDRVALIVGRFGLDDWLSGDLVQTMLVRADPTTNTFTPKNPSPARLRRVWETCQRFWTETVEREILARHHCYGAQNPGLRCARLLLTPDKTSGWREDVPYDGAVDGRAISLLWRKDGQQFITISNLELAGDIQPGQTIFVSEPDRPQQISFVVQSKAQATGKMGAYTPCLRLLASPDQFLALVPAAAALEIAKNIRQEYQKQFGKVQNRLPLFLGLVFFQRKISLTAVMDTARRMLASEFANGEWRITDAPQNNGKMVTLSLEQNGQCVTLQVPIVMGDGTTPDNWYPYFFFSGTPSHAQHYFQHNGNCLVHVNDLKQGDEIEITPSRFTYLFLETTARRFRFDPERDVMLLDELPRLMKMWDDLKGSGITDTGLRNVQALLERKGETWGRKSKEFEHLAHTTLKEAGLFKRKDQNGNSLPDVVTPQDVVSGRFARCLELHLYILKLKIKESQGGVPT
jgi:hypothetical protein